MSRKEIAETLRTLKVEDVFTVFTNPTTVREDTLIIQVLEMLVKDPLTHVVYVVDAAGKLKGVIGDTEVLRWLSFQAAEGRAPKGLEYFDRTVDTMIFALGTQARHFMSISKTLKPKDVLVDALNTMLASGQEELPVVDENNVVIGDLSCLEVIYGMLKTLESKKFKP